MPNATRWNSLFDALRHIQKMVECSDNSKAEKERVSKTKINLNTVFDFLNIPKLTAQDYTFISEYVTVMTPLAHALDVLQGEQGTNVTSGNLLPTIVVIRDAFKAMRDESELLIAESLLNAVDAGLTKRFDPFFELEELQLAAALHPKFKLTWLNEESPRDRPLKKIIVARIEKKLIELTAESAAKKLERGKNTPEEPKDFYSSLKKNHTETRNCQSKLDFAKYLEAKITNDLSILNEYPHIKTLYLQYNTGLPASAACERLFSLGARVLTPTRSLLSDKNFERLVFLKSNKAVIDA